MLGPAQPQFVDNYFQSALVLCVCVYGGGEFPYLILFVPDASPFVAKYFSPGSFKLMFRSVQHEAEAAFS